jgi:dihydrofolate reductase
MKMSKVLSALSVSVDGYITGRDPAPGQGLGDGGMLFDWYFSGEVPSQVMDGFKLSEPSARLFDALASRVGASLAGRNTYDDSDRFGDTGAPHPTAPLVVLSHRPAPQQVLHQVPILLGGGRSYFQSLPEHVSLSLVEAVAAPGVTHLHYEVAR